MFVYMWDARSSTISLEKGLFNELFQFSETAGSTFSWERRLVEAVPERLARVMPVFWSLPLGLVCWLIWLCFLLLLIAVTELINCCNVIVRWRGYVWSHTTHRPSQSSSVVHDRLSRWHKIPITRVINDGKKKKPWNTCDCRVKWQEGTVLKGSVCVFSSRASLRLRSSLKILVTVHGSQTQFITLNFKLKKKNLNFIQIRTKWNKIKIPLTFWSNHRVGVSS